MSQKNIAHGSESTSSFHSRKFVFVIGIILVGALALTLTSFQSGFNQGSGSRLEIVTYNVADSDWVSAAPAGSTVLAKQYTQPGLAELRSEAAPAIKADWVPAAPVGSTVLAKQYFQPGLAEPTSDIAPAFDVIGPDWVPAAPAGSTVLAKQYFQPGPTEK